jgi:ATP-binding cassette subfamily B protein
MLYINTLLTLYVLIPMPLIVFGTRFFSKKMHSLYQAVQASFADLTEAVRERFAGIRVIKAYNLEEQESLRINTISKNYINRNLRLVRTTGLFFPMLIFFSNVSLAIVLFLGGRKTITLDITPGDFVAFISYLGLLTWPMMAMGWVINLIQRGKASLDRINTILSVKPEIDETAHAGSLKEIKNSMVFENVSFSYTGNDSLVLSNININLKHGSILGIIGPQGSGKTTLLNLIPRLYEVSSGKILIDGINISEVSPRDLRSLVSFMPQEPFLFAGSIKQNILTGTGEEKSSQLKSAAEKAALYDTVKLFPGGFDTIIGEKGIILSGGQKQRIALARAFIHDRPVMIFDDPVSQVDMETGNLIIKNIKSMARRKTVIIVSHRLSAVRFADLIISLDSGKIVESGTHEQLMQNNGYYAKTFRLQEIEEEINAN